MIAVRKLKDLFAFFSNHHVLGIPLDWPVRFVLIGGLYILLQTKLSAKRSCAICLAVLLLKETFDVFAVRSFSWARLPDWGDAADIAVGLAGIACAILVVRLRRGKARGDRVKQLDAQ